jgi:hypothetical protein
VASPGGLSSSLLLGWALWAVDAATVLPWLPLFTMDVTSAARSAASQPVYLTTPTLGLAGDGEHVRGWTDAATGKYWRTPKLAPM